MPVSDNPIYFFSKIATKPVIRFLGQIVHRRNAV